MEFMEWIYIALIGVLMLECGAMINCMMQFHKYISGIEEASKSVKPPVDNTKYSQDLLDFIKRFTMEVTVLETNAFFDSHETSMLTKEQIKNLVKHVAKEVNHSLVVSNIDYERALYTKEFIDTYIIQISVNSIKEILDKRIEGGLE